MPKENREGKVCSFEIVGILDTHAAEALRLEIGRLARRYGIEVKSLYLEALKEAKDVSG